jgi:nucleotide-binding universal stress UspA family protein
MDLENAFPPESLTPFNLMAIHPAFEGIDVKTAKHWSQLPWVVVLPLAMEIVERWAANEFARLRQILPMAKRGQVEFHALHGDPVNQTVKFSEAISAKLIVLAAHKHSRADRLINGSHADNLLHASRIPVIVVCDPAKSEPGMPQEILLTTDFSPESLPVFLVLNDLIQGAKPNITVLTVETAHEHHAKASAVLEGLETAFRSLGLQLKTVKINASNVEAGILDYVKAHKPQLIAMSSHGRLGFAELIHPSVTKAILHDAGVPILVVHGNAMPVTETVGNLSDFLRMITG